MKLDETGIWVIGDVHGEYDILMQLIQKLPINAKICFVGDLVDRGEKSAEVLDFVMANNHFCVLGNHELMMLNSTREHDTNCLWLINGGQETLNSYDTSNFEAHKARGLGHLRWIRQLPYFLHFEIDGHKPLVVSHSYLHHVWINKEHIYCEYDGEDIIWRHMDKKKYFETAREVENGIYNVFGHYPVREAIVTDTYAMIDTGVAYKDKKGFGKLSALHYPSLEIVSYGSSELC
ncbi:MAG: metallophosphoesterase [Campylobacteraceae bacterium]|nr:metallophosphoesterase [Campylobacteraceae bacterium]